MRHPGSGRETPLDHQRPVEIPRVVIGTVEAGGQQQRRPMGNRPVLGTRIVGRVVVGKPREIVAVLRLNDVLQGEKIRVIDGLLGRVQPVDHDQAIGRDLANGANGPHHQRHVTMHLNVGRLIDQVEAQVVVADFLVTPRERPPMLHECRLRRCVIPQLHILFRRQLHNPPLAVMGTETRRAVQAEVHVHSVLLSPGNRGIEPPKLVFVEDQPVGGRGITAVIQRQANVIETQAGQRLEIPLLEAPVRLLPLNCVHPHEIESPPTAARDRFGIEERFDDASRLRTPTGRSGALHGHGGNGWRGGRDIAPGRLRRGSGVQATGRQQGDERQAQAHRKRHFGKTADGIWHVGSYFSSRHLRTACASLAD